MTHVVRVEKFLQRLLSLLFPTTCPAALGRSSSVYRSSHLPSPSGLPEAHWSLTCPFLFHLAFSRTSCSSVTTVTVATICTVSPRPCLSLLKVGCPDLLRRTSVILVTWKITCTGSSLKCSFKLGHRHFAFTQNAFLAFQLGGFNICTLGTFRNAENQQPKRKLVLSGKQLPRSGLLPSSQSRKLSL